MAQPWLWYSTGIPKGDNQQYFEGSALIDFVIFSRVQFNLFLVLIYSEKNLQRFFLGRHSISALFKLVSPYLIL